ncbi:MAG: helix-turn-helix domain-containing protein [bacterium]
MLSVDDVSNILNINRSKCYELVNNNIIPNKRIGRRIIIPKKSFLEWLNAS